MVHNLGSLSVKLETAPSTRMAKRPKEAADASKSVVTSLKARKNICEAGLEWLPDEISESVCQDLKHLNRGPHRVQSCLQSRWSQKHITLSR